jgi:hypothetical protein
MTNEAMRTRPGLAFQLVFVIYLAAISGLGREFAHLHVTVAGLPLFSGELTIALLGILGAAHLRATRGRGFRVDGAVITLAVFLFIGCVFAVVGLTRGFGVAAVRDFALVYYASFFLFTLVFLESGGAPATVILSIIAGAAVGTTWSLVLFLVAPTLIWGHGAPGHQAIVAWVAVLGAAAFGSRSAPRSLRAAGLLVTVCASSVVFLSAHRTMLFVFVGLAIAVGALLLWRNRPSLRRILVAAIASLVLWAGLVAGMAALARPSGAQTQAHGPMTMSQALWVISIRWTGLGFVGLNAASRWIAQGREPPSTGSRSVFPFFSVPSVATGQSLSFRKSAWRNAARRIAASPLFGIGFGPSPNLSPDRHCELITSPTSNCGNAHNTYLTLAMRMGIPMLVLFLLTNAIECARAVRTLGRTSDPHIEAALVFSLAALLSLGAYASLNLFLESPYLSSLYWVILALMHEVRVRADREVLPGPSARALGTGRLG